MPATQPTATPAVVKVGSTHPDHPELGFLGLACRFHEAEARKAGWRVKPYDGPGLCHFCLKGKQ